MPYPANTNPLKLSNRIGYDVPSQMTVVFATNQSLEVISIAQRKYGLPDFDLAIMDEAHRTAGDRNRTKKSDEKDSEFIKIMSKTISDLIGDSI
ncbi:MAG: DEAD/DEAH box helicase family protein [Bacteroidetes bacterium]|nr:DEAD/DEAH box helicase family protein [Bacteroidota bacterium]MCY4233209.1 DEAD/DEAH box helicase family protein [Bacteroidota bacterium]